MGLGLWLIIRQVPRRAAGVNAARCKTIWQRTTLQPLLTCTRVASHDYCEKKAPWLGYSGG